MMAGNAARSDPKAEASYRRAGVQDEPNLIGDSGTAGRAIR
jgi:hypothetical protein